jgi:hypothetical protein
LKPEVPIETCILRAATLIAHARCECIMRTPAKQMA